jgi:hypothetical protein
MSISLASNVWLIQRVRAQSRATRLAPAFSVNCRDGDDVKCEFMASREKSDFWRHWRHDRRKSLMRERVKNDDRP